MRYATNNNKKIFWFGISHKVPQVLKTLIPKNYLFRQNIEITPKTIVVINRYVVARPVQSTMNTNNKINPKNQNHYIQIVMQQFGYGHVNKRLSNQSLAPLKEPYRFG